MKNDISFRIREIDVLIEMEDEPDSLFESTQRGIDRLMDMDRLNLIHYDKFYREDKIRFQKFNQYFAMQAAKLFQQILEESLDINTFKPLILVGEKCSAKDKVIEFLENTFPGKFTSSSLQDAAS